MFHLKDTKHQLRRLSENFWVTTILPGAVVPLAAAIFFHYQLNSFRLVHLPFHSFLESVGAFCAVILAVFIITMRNSQYYHNAQ